MPVQTWTSPISFPIPAQEVAVEWLPPLHHISDIPGSKVTPKTGYHFVHNNKFSLEGIFGKASAAVAQGA
jgi:hypothetical protein